MARVQAPFRQQASAGEKAIMPTTLRGSCESSQKYASWLTNAFIQQTCRDGLGPDELVTRLLVTRLLVTRLLVTRLVIQIQVSRVNQANRQIG